MLQSVLRARRGSTFTMSEVGARWGPWGARAAAFARVVRPDLRHSLHFVEPDPRSCDGIRIVAQLNQLDSSIDCGYARAAAWTRWAERQEFIDLVDIDIQGHEQTFVRAIAHVLRQKVARVIVGTHGTMGNEAKAPRNATGEALDRNYKRRFAHEQVKAVLADWILLSELVPVNHYRCIVRHMRGNKLYKADRFDWAAMKAKGCYHSTPLGPVAAWDGELIFDNPRFVNRSRALSLADTELRIDDLQPF